jgi:hypothetical protein
LELLEHAGKALSEKWKGLSIDELYEGWLEEITDLVSRLQKTQSSGGDAKTHLVEEFNDADNQRNYIQFLRARISFTACDPMLTESDADSDLHPGQS